ncbi:hypothetical protein HMPREF9069_00718 [Atopobium sp. oral taxon 810 str. F0209]|nr:hypothetical protein HMPREF9069_00718 [Atopobium sp. oral taxon 810 str. F0209]
MVQKRPQPYAGGSIPLQSSQTVQNRHSASTKALLTFLLRVLIEPVV